jgi:hypothetical protein
VKGFCEDGNELPGSITGGEYLDYLDEYSTQKEFYTIEFVSYTSGKEINPSSNITRRFITHSLII